MELQWPLILFTTLVAWSAGLFGTQALMALRGGGDRAQLPALVTAIVLLAAGGIAVFFHLEHWERIFNGFGHLTSGITQELIAIVVVVVLMVAYVICLRRSENGGVPRWLAGVSLAACIVLVIVMAHSYTMAARPAWKSVLWILYVLGNSCILGPTTMAVIMAVRGDDLAVMGLPVLVGAIANAVSAVAFAVFLQFSSASFAEVGYYFDPTHPTEAMAVAADVVAAQTPLLWVGAVIVGALIPLVVVFSARRNGGAVGWKLWGAVAAAAALIGAVCLRVVFYELGLSAFMFY